MILFILLSNVQPWKCRNGSCQIPLNTMFSPSRPEQMEQLESGTERAFSAPVKWTRVSGNGHAPLFSRGPSDQYNTAPSERRGYCSAGFSVITALGGMVQTAKRASTRTSYVTRPYELETRVWQLARKQKARLELPREAGTPESKRRASFHHFRNRRPQATGMPLLFCFRFFCF